MGNGSCGAVPCAADSAPGDTWPVGAVGVGTRHAGAGYSPPEAGLCQGQQWLLTLDAGCWWVYVLQLCQIIALALLRSPKMYRCVQAWCGHPWEWVSSGGSALAGSPQVSELERLPMPPASWHFTLR